MKKKRNLSYWEI